MAFISTVVSSESNRGYGVEDVKQLIYCYVDFVKKLYGDNLVSIALFGSIARGKLSLKAT